MMKPATTSLTHLIAPFDDSQTGLHPALVLLHGRGANEEDLLGLVPYLDPQFFFAAPRAPFPFAHGGYTWYELEEIGSPNKTQFAESYERLVQFLDDIQQQYPVDPNRTYLLGFSMGTVMAYSLALTKPEIIRGMVAHSGYIPEHIAPQFQWESMSHTAFFVAHGIHDPVIPIEFGRRAHELLAKKNARVVYHEYPIQHQISDESLRDLSGWLAGCLKSAS